MFEYDSQVYNTKSAKIVVPVVLNIVQPQSIVDVGCGIGTWLKIFNEYGVKDYLGIDGEYVNRSQLLIPETHFLPADLTVPLTINRKFDLVISLEVAEHISESATNVYLKNLITLGEKILFSAAIPGQGGQNHVNEQWPLYWQEKFNEFGYAILDILRNRIWNDENIEWWYRQNMFLIIKKELVNNSEIKPIMPIVHPDLFNFRNSQYNKSINHGHSLWQYSQELEKQAKGLEQEVSKLKVDKQTLLHGNEKLSLYIKMLAKALWRKIKLM